MDSPRAPRPIAAWLTIWIVMLWASGSGMAAGPKDRMPLLMPDDFVALQLTDWRVELGQPDEENPLIEGEMPWDAGGVGIHGSVFQDPITQSWKAYLVCTPAEEDPQKQPENLGKPWASENHSHRRICLFESDDGVHWKRPELSNVTYEGNDKTNIIFDVNDGVSAYSSILVDPNSREWPYQMFVLRESWSAVKGMPPEGNGYYRYRSHDGRKWESLGGKIKGPMTGDLCFFYRVGGPLSPFYDPGPGDISTKFSAYYRLPGMPQPNDHLPAYEDAPRRSCFRGTSEDGFEWQRDEAMHLTADERDHRDTQYQECVPIQVPGGFVALVTMYHPITQTLNLRMAASRDARHWWFPDRRPCLDNAPIGDFGGGMIWQSQYLHVIDGRLVVYYGGTEGPHRLIHDTRAPSLDINYQEKVIDHGAHFIPFNAALCRASWSYGRMYALTSSAGGPTVGVATTKPLDLPNRELWINVVTRAAKNGKSDSPRNGRLQVELLDEGGNVIPGFGRDDCLPITGDHAAIQARWKGHATAPKNAVQARFYLRRAFLYGFETRGKSA